MAILDLDRFKLYNDTHGHQAGDRFLKQMAGAWTQALRAGDILARYGGEEFALALPGTNLEHAQQMLERLREALPEGQTCSAGVCLWDGDGERGVPHRARRHRALRGEGRRARTGSSATSAT